MGTKPPKVTWRWARAIGRKIERGLADKNPDVRAMAAVAQQLGRALKDHRERHGTVCGICIFNDASYRTFKRDRDGGGWNLCCRTCAPIARRNGWEVQS